MPNRITLFGFYGRMNTGDDAMLSGIINYLLANCNSQIVIPTNVKPVLNDQSERIKIIPRNFLRISICLLSSKHFVLGGGTLVHTKGSRLKFKIMVTRILLMIVVAKVFRCKVSFISSGFGPFDNLFGIWSCKLIIFLCTYINVRDNESYALLCSLGASKKKISKTSDFAYLLKCKFTSSDFYSNINNEIRIAINLMPYDTEYLNKVDNSRIIDSVSLAIRELLGSCLITRIDLLCFNGDESPVSGDKSLLSLLYKKINDPRVFFANYSLDPNYFIEIIASCKLFLTMKYHGVVYSSITGTPCISIGYHPKCDALVEELNIPEIKSFPLETIYNPGEIVNIIKECLLLRHFESIENKYQRMILNSFPRNYFY